MLLGGGANLILFCLLKAFDAVEISSLQPFRYVELLFAGFFGWTFFGEMPSVHTLLGAGLIIPATLYIACYETWRQRKKAVKIPV
jgi:S-adenosylmethionine uptake transporter